MGNIIETLNEFRNFDFDKISNNTYIVTKGSRGVGKTLFMKEWYKRIIFKSELPLSEKQKLLDKFTKLW